MFASKLPDPWVIAEVERQRRNREQLRDDRPCLELPVPPPARPDAPEADARPSVIVIDLW